MNKTVYRAAYSALAETITQLTFIFLLTGWVSSFVMLVVMPRDLIVGLPAKYALLMALVVFCFVWFAETVKEMKANSIKEIVNRYKKGGRKK